MLNRKTALVTALVVCFVGMSSVSMTQTHAASELLEVGMSGSEVTSLQDSLIKLGYLNESSTGYYGEVTKAAVESFQSSNGLDADGVVGSETLSLIEKKVAEKNTVQSSDVGILSEGMSGSNIKLLQDKLNALGYLSESSTGYYGELTKAAIERFQSKNGLDADGVAGTETLSLINKQLGTRTIVPKEEVSKKPEITANAGVLMEEMTGDEITALQDNLRTLGYLKVSSTGYYGGLTKSAVQRLQSDNGLDDDGVAGNATLALIDKLLNAKSSAPKAAGTTGSLKEEMLGSRVTQLQNDLKKLGYFDVSATGYYGSLTKAAVKSFQKAYGLEQDGIAGGATLAKIGGLLGTKVAMAEPVSRGSSGSSSSDYLVAWYGGAENILRIGDIAEVYDIWTGRTFKIKRTYGYNHADCETLTAEDTQIMKSIYGGEWSWARRPIIVTVNGRDLAASMAGMPHAGVEGAAANSYVSPRSGGYGGGDNLDAVKGNNMSGVFDVHFLNSRTHGSNKVDSKHQNAIKEAANWAQSNF